MIQQPRFEHESLLCTKSLVNDECWFVNKIIINKKGTIKNKFF